MARFTAVLLIALVAFAACANGKSITFSKVKKSPAVAKPTVTIVAPKKPTVSIVTAPKSGKSFSMPTITMPTFSKGRKLTKFITLTKSSPKPMMTISKPTITFTKPSPAPKMTSSKGFSMPTFSKPTITITTPSPAPKSSGKGFSLPTFTKPTFSMPSFGKGRKLAKFVKISPAPKTFTLPTITITKPSPAPKMTSSKGFSMPTFSKPAVTFTKPSPAPKAFGKGFSLPTFTKPTFSMPTFGKGH